MTGHNFLNLWNRDVVENDIRSFDSSQKGCSYSKQKLKELRRKKQLLGFTWKVAIKMVCDGLFICSVSGSSKNHPQCPLLPDDEEDY